jgi:hypothetical protein
VGFTRSVGWERLGRRRRGLLSHGAAENYSTQYEDAR